MPFNLGEKSGLAIPATAQNSNRSNKHHKNRGDARADLVQSEKKKNDKDREPDNDKIKGKHKGETKGKHKGHRH